MAKLSKEEQARLEGMNYALKVAKEKGIDALEEELKWRGAYGVPLKVSQKDLDAYSQNVREQTFTTVLTLMLVDIRDEFGFGKKRLQRLIDHFWLSTAALSDGNYGTWQDYLDILKNECGLELEITTSNESNYHLKGN